MNRIILGSPLVFLAAAFLCVGLESLTLLDRLAQSIFFTDGNWLLSAEFHKQYKLPLYTLPKIMVAALGALALCTVIVSLLPAYKQRLRQWRSPALALLASIIVVPLTVAVLKAATGIYSPVDLVPYGGKHQHVGLLEQLWNCGRVAGGRSFPAGHASGGFALLALCCLPLRCAWRTALFWFGMTAGWGMGLYQMARGEHFLSHTLTTMFIALTVTSWLCGRLRHNSSGPRI